MTNQNSYKFVLDQNLNIKKNNIEYFLRYIDLLNKNPINIQDFNKINTYTYLLKIVGKVLNILRI